MSDHVGEWGLKDIRRRVTEMQELFAGTELENGDGIEIVGDEIRLNIAALPLAPEN